ncbi:hypothetical protein SAY87_028137 [Trapa incisa]|uniref:Protein prenyltransferase alpha subunit repeat-containing protein 1 n=1 Tax=Trapa incisa TaxID=236973 RepID=A0AAN7QRC2_9MYRT|nr:hypothetical protein SAY87_028137 [Trapa incisa]
MADRVHLEEESCGLLLELEHILDSDPLIDEVGFIHPTQLAALIGVVDCDSSGDLDTLKFFNRDHKLGISTQILFPLYKQAKIIFFDEIERYKKQTGISGIWGDETSLQRCKSTLDELEIGVMKHSKVLLLLSADLATAWNSRRAIVLKKDTLSMYMDELRLSELILSYSAKSDQAWSHRRWVIKRIVGKLPNLQEVIGKESKLVERIAERSKMNYRAWNHRCWLVSYMTGERVVYELKNSRVWAGLHVADSSCFHYRRRLMMRMLEDFCAKNASVSVGSSSEIYDIWKEELEWNKLLIKRYIGREALWLYRRFLSLHWLRDFMTQLDSVIFLDDELHLLHSCSIIPDSDFDDFQAQAMYSTTYILWLARQLSRSHAIVLRQKLQVGDMKDLLNSVCPQRSFFCDMLEE